MTKEIFGLSPQIFDRRIETEKRYAEELAKICVDMIDEIKNTKEPNGWHRLVIFDTSTGNELLNSIAPFTRLELVYYLRQHPNIISKLSDRDISGRSDTLKPFMYKWVSEEEKIQLGVNAIYFKGVDANLIDYIKNFSTGASANYVDILSVMEFLLTNSSDEWFETTTINISLRTGVLLENVCAALNELLRMKLIVIAYKEGKRHKTKFRQFIKVTLYADEHKEALTGEEIGAFKTIGEANLPDEEFKFIVRDYFFSLLKSFEAHRDFYRNNASAKLAAETNLFNEIETESLPIESAEEKIFPADEEFNLQVAQSLAEIKTALAEVNIQPADEEFNSQVTQSLAEIKSALAEVNVQPADNKLILQMSKSLEDIENYLTRTPQENELERTVVGMIPKMSQILEDTKNCVNSFAEMAKEVHNADEKKFSTMDELIQQNLQQQKELEELRKKILFYDKIKDQYKQVIRQVQKALNMMMGQIISEIESFTKTPRYNMNEELIAKCRYNIVQIAMKADEEIKKAFTSPKVK